jgi:D-alanyl-D-alanine carboxypeptidase
MQALVRRRGASPWGVVRGVAAAALISVAVSGCTGGEGVPRPSGTVSVAPSVGSAPADSAALTARFRELAEGMRVPGAAMLIRTPAGEITSTYGTTTLGGSTPVSLDDHVRVGSNTKTWTGTVILQLVQEGKIALSDPVSKYRPDVPNGKNITIEELLNMRSGLFNYTETYELNHQLDVNPQRAWQPEELVAMGDGLPVYFAPGEGYHYSNTNYVLLGLIAEQIEAEPLQQIFQQRLFGPLGLTQTSFPSIDDASIPTPSTNGYMYTDNVLTLSESRLPADLLAQAEAGTLRPNDETHLNPSWAWAAGGGISTIRDLATWVKAMVGGHVLLNPDLQQRRLKSVIPISKGASTAYGWGIGQLRPGIFGHTGELPGYNSYMGYDPSNKVTVVVWTNLAPAANGMAPAKTIANSLIDKLYGPKTQTPTSAPGHSE